MKAAGSRRVHLMTMKGSCGLVERQERRVVNGLNSWVTPCSMFPFVPFCSFLFPFAPYIGNPSFFGMRTARSAWAGLAAAARGVQFAFGMSGFVRICPEMSGFVRFLGNFPFSGRARAARIGRRRSVGNDGRAKDWGRKNETPLA